MELVAFTLKMKITKQDIYFYISLLTAIYFALVCGAWMYFMNLVIGFPVFVISYFFWRKGKKNDLKSIRYKYIPHIWLCGIPISILSLAGYIIFN
jgi:O-antigen/teichoic acid export membrane protein